MKAAIILSTLFLGANLFAIEMPKKITCVKETPSGTRTFVLEQAANQTYSATVTFSTNDPEPVDHVYDHEEISVSGLACSAGEVTPLLRAGCDEKRELPQVLALYYGFYFLGKPSQLGLDEETFTSLRAEGILRGNASDFKADRSVQIQVDTPCKISQ